MVNGWQPGCTLPLTLGPKHKMTWKIYIKSSKVWFTGVTMCIHLYSCWLLMAWCFLCSLSCKNVEKKWARRSLAVDGSTLMSQRKMTIRTGAGELLQPLHPTYPTLIGFREQGTLSNCVPISQEQNSEDSVSASWLKLNGSWLDSLTWLVELHRWWG